MSAHHDLERGRDWTRLTKATELVSREPRTLYRWIEAGYIRSQKARGRTFVNIPDLMRTEAAIAEGRTPEPHPS